METLGLYVQSESLVQRLLELGFPMYTNSTIRYILNIEEQSPSANGEQVSQ